MMTVISAPGDLVVATSDGIGVRFAGVELTIHLPGHPAAVPGERGIKVNLGVFGATKPSIAIKASSKLVSSGLSKEELRARRAPGTDRPCPGCWHWSQLA
jgi:hypothetical protein